MRTYATRAKRSLFRFFIVKLLIHLTIISTRCTTYNFFDPHPTDCVFVGLCGERVILGEKFGHICLLLPVCSQPGSSSVETSPVRYPSLRFVWWYFRYLKSCSWRTYVKERMNPLDLSDRLGSEYWSSWENIPDSHIIVSA